MWRVVKGSTVLTITSNDVKRHVSASLPLWLEKDAEKLVKEMNKLFDAADKVADVEKKKQRELNL